MSSSSIFVKPKPHEEPLLSGNRHGDGETYQANHCGAGEMTRPESACVQGSEFNPQNLRKDSWVWRHLVTLTLARQRRVDS